MNSMREVKDAIQTLKSSGIPLSEAAWKAAQMCLGWPYIFGDRGQECTPSHRRGAYNAHPDATSILSKCQMLREKDQKSSCDGCKWYPEGCRVGAFDCRGFTYWILLQIYGWKLMGAGCTSQWNDEANWKQKGEVADGITQGVIVCLFYYKKDKSGNRTKTLEHTGFYYNGETLECSNGVQHSKTLSKKWEVWGIPACVEEAGTLPEIPEPAMPETPAETQGKKPTISKGAKGCYVTEMQTLLIRMGYGIGKTGADGIFGANTKSGLIAFQKEIGLYPDGICGPLTWTALENAVKEKDEAEEKRPKLYTVHIQHVTEEEANKIIDQHPGSWVTVE